MASSHGNGVPPRYRTRSEPHLADIAALRADGLGYRAIACAIHHFTGARLTEYHVEGALRRMGEPPMASKARPRPAQVVHEEAMAA